MASESSAAWASGGVRDFERSVVATAAGHSARASGGVETTELRSRGGLELVGFRWTAGDPLIEVRSLGRGGWSDWTLAPHDGDHAPDTDALTRERGRKLATDPVWTGHTRRVQVRVRGRVRGLKAHFVTISGRKQRKLARTAGTGGASPGVLPSPTQTGSTSPGDAGTGSSPGTVADAPPPAYVSRSQWGANSGCKPRSSSGYGEVLGAAVHHTVSTNTYSADQAPSVVLAICRYHRNSNRWHDIGYNALIDRFGTIYEGRAGGLSRAVAGAHAQGYNGQTTGVALVGSHMTTPASGEALASLRTWLAWKLPLHGVTRNERVSYMSTGGGANRFAYGKIIFREAVSGHRDFDTTTCPGNQLYDVLPGVASSFLASSDRSATRLSMRLRRGVRGSRTIDVVGRIRGAGALLKGKTVLIQGYTAAGWTTMQRVESDQDGIYRGAVALSNRTFLRVAFEGDGRYRPGRSAWRYAPKLP